MFPTPRVATLGWCLVVGGVALAPACVNGAETPQDFGAHGGEAGAGVAAREGGAGGSQALASAGASGTDDSSYAGTATSGDTCVPGATRCHGDLGFQRCEPEGEWGTSQTCAGYSDNGTSSYCAVVDSGDTPWAACVDPACWWWIRSGLATGDDAAGVCVGGEQYRPCHEDGILGRTQDCEGACTVVGELDGRALGYCSAACQAGERECLVGPLYRECVAGRWSTELRACEGGAPCQPLASGQRAGVRCGGACEPGTSRCSQDGTGVEACSEEGAWQAARPCLLGRCVRSGAQAQCQTECRPGERSCAFDGASAEATCSEAGLWSEPTLCAEGASCRIGTAGALGCLVCVGSEVAGGNTWGVADLRCDGAGVSKCGPDDSFLAAEVCPDGLGCTEVQRGMALLAYCE